MATTTFGDQVINTIDNLNMKGKFKEDSLRQFENLNTAVIKYTDNLGVASEGSKLQLYDSISESLIQFELVVLPPNTRLNQFLRDNNSANTAQNLVDRINDITLQGTATNNHYSAIIEYFDDLFNVTPDGTNDTIVLETSSDGNNDVTFTMKTSGSLAATDFLQETSADATATNLCNAINNHSLFSAIIDITKNIIIITQISTTKPANNTNNFSNTELKLTNFSNLSATIDKSNNTITVIQNSSKSYKDNSIVRFENSSDNTIALNVQNFRVNSDDEAAIPSETIGTYQIIDKIITDLSLLKKKITSRNKILQNDLSNDHTDSNGVDLTEPVSDTSNKVATYISNFIPIGNTIGDKDRGNLDDTTSKPSIFESDTIKYSEDALFTLLKGLFYEILKFKNGITDGVNNGGTSGGAGKQSIPIAISASNNTGAVASLTNVIATIENINKSDGTFDVFKNTSNTSIPSENTGSTIKFVGLLQLINEFIKNLVEIKNQIKINESELLTALNANNSDPAITVSNVDSKITILKVRNGFTEDNNSTDNFHKPSIFTSDKKYSEDAVFGLFSCISYELMKLLNGTYASNNNSPIGFAGLQAIPASIEDV